MCSIRHQATVFSSPQTLPPDFALLVTKADRVMASQRCNPQNLKIDYIIWQGAIKVADRIKLANQLTLRKEREYLGLSTWPLCNHRGPQIGKREEESQNRRGDTMRKIRPATARSEDARWGHEPRNVRSLYNLEKARK